MEKIVGVIAEYNPLHKGHLYHIRKSRSRAQIDAIIAVISSNFVQRGLPAMIDKGTRARMALACGADLVLELPVAFSSHNAGLFANAAVDILAATGVVSELSFGMENPAFDAAAVADLLNDDRTISGWRSGDICPRDEASCRRAAWRLTRSYPAL